MGIFPLTFSLSRLVRWGVHQTLEFGEIEVGALSLSLWDISVWAIK